MEMWPRMQQASKRSSCQVTRLIRPLCVTRCLLLLHNSLCAVKAMGVKMVLSGEGADGEQRTARASVDLLELEER